MLGTEAVYRVCGVDEQLAEVEVIRGPGLHRGQRFTFDLAAVRAMTVLRDADATPPPGEG